MLSRKWWCHNDKVKSNKFLRTKLAHRWKYECYFWAFLWLARLHASVENSCQPLLLSLKSPTTDYLPRPAGHCQRTHFSGFSFQRAVYSVCRGGGSNLLVFSESFLSTRETGSAWSFPVSLFPFPWVVWYSFKVTEVTSFRLPLTYWPVRPMSGWVASSFLVLSHTTYISLHTYTFI